jgi:hypothetical protein
VAVAVGVRVNVTGVRPLESEGLKGPDPFGAARPAEMAVRTGVVVRVDVRSVTVNDRVVRHSAVRC